MNPDCRHLEALLHQDIPLTRAMHLGVTHWDGRTLCLSLPLAPNVNHMSTQFGGSLYCAAVLAGWGWLHLRLREAGVSDGHIVIQQSAIDYPLPVRSDAEAICSAPDERAWERFLTIYRRRGRARLTLDSRIPDASGRDAVRFSGQFVVHR
ncbi:thioesterase domain-containing protein [Stutzerimonas azotifigens]|uniref:thioesterase domain-containing protein n=1 Tax=Stutzerimonas azotifigens TaxID=291995 RepID=UPI0004886225|nr:thioesterase domain-containing protein [Stutzerimonas azotifigens]